MDINTFYQWQMKVGCPGIIPTLKPFTALKLHGRLALKDVVVNLYILLMSALDEGE
jgi:hypothetical protein